MEGDYIMAYKTFFSDFISLENQFFAENAVDIPSVQSRETYQALREFLFGFSWTKSENTKFIVMNMHLSSECMAVKYNAQAKDSKEKSSSTFRVQKAAVSKFLYSIFGEDYRDAFYSQDLDEHEEQDRRLRKIEITINLMQDDNDDKFKMNLPMELCQGGSMKTYSMKDCEHEILFLSRCTNCGLLKEFSELDSDKLSFLFSILHGSILTGDSLNNKKLDLLNRISYYAENMKYTRMQMQKEITRLKTQLANREAIERMPESKGFGFSAVSLSEDDILSNAL